MYSELVLDHFQHPRNVGELVQPDAAAQLENPACGDVLRLTLRIQDGRIAEVRFRARGCVAAIACGSALTGLLLNRSLAEARALRPEQVVDALGGLPPESNHASHLALDTLATALQNLKP